MGPSTRRVVWTDSIASSCANVATHRGPLVTCDPGLNYGRLRPLGEAEWRSMVKTESTAPSGLVDPKVNVRIVLAILWICHFILWIFGDMFSLLQEMTEPATDTTIQFVAPSTAIVLTLLVAFTLVGRPDHVRLGLVSRERGSARPPLEQGADGGGSPGRTQRSIGARHANGVHPPTQRVWRPWPGTP